MDTERQDDVGQPFSHLVPLEHGRGSCRPRPGVPALLLTLGVFEPRLRDCSGPVSPSPCPLGPFLQSRRNDGCAQWGICSIHGRPLPSPGLSFPTPSMR